MNRLILRWPLLVALAFALPVLSPLSTPRAFAQATSSGTIVGVVTDQSGALIPGATITVTDPTTKTSRTATSNNDGSFVLVDVQPGKYNIKATKDGFSITEISGQAVSVGTQTTANFKMAIGAETTTVEVQSSNADLQTMNASTGQTVDSAMVDSLPAINRDVATFVTMQPGVTPGGNVAGTTTDQATFQLDGGSNSSDMDGTQATYTSSFGGSTTGGFLAAGPAGVMPMPQDSVEEFKVSTSGQTADFNNSSGSQSQIVTKRGHDKIHGSLYEYYLDSNIGANTWQNNFAGTGYTKKASYHFNRFGVAVGGPIAPYLFGGKTYLFANYEGFRYPLAATFERTVPSYQFLQQGQLTFPPTGTSAVTYTKPQLQAADPRNIGMSATMANFYNTQLPVAPASNTGSTGNNGTVYAGVFDQSCGALSTAYCDGVNTIGFRANVLTPQSSNFGATRLDHDFGEKWHLMMSYRYYNLQSLTSNQVDIGGGLPGDKVGSPVATAPRPQNPWFFVVGLTTNINSSLTNDFHYSYLRNSWQWKSGAAPAQVAGAGGALEPLGESATLVLAPYNVNAQSIRTRIWDGKDNFFRDDLTKLAGNHLIQFGGQYQHNFNYHQRTDNGAGINYTPTYQVGDAGGGGNVTYTGLNSVGAGTAAYARLLDTYYGIVTDTQVANTYANNGGTLTLNPSLTPIGANTTIPYYNIYVTDTWHAKPSLTVNYGISYALEMPPTERNGNQVMWTDATGNALHVDDWLNSRKAAALTGTVYNPTIGFALLKNVVGHPKYSYNPYYGSASPRVSASWNPKFDSGLLAKLFGPGSTVIRGGYGRIYGRINGDVQVLNPLLSPGLILATQCKYAQGSAARTSGTGSGTCTQGPTYTDSTAYRFGATTGATSGPDGLTPVLTNAALPTTLAQPYRPGFDGPGVALASPNDPSVRPNDVDTINFSIQRQLNRKMVIEVGYIGRLIHHEYIMKNPNTVPYMMVLGGQSFQSAYLAVEQAFGCTTSAGLCSANTTKATAKAPVYPTVTAQPFFEAAFGNANPTGLPSSNASYCVGYTSCTAAVVAKQAGKFGAQQVFALWQALDNNTNGAAGSGFTFGRSLMGTTTSNATYGGAGQVTTGLSMGTADGYSNYHGGYASFKASDFHGITLNENFTWSKALGLNAYTQSTSSTSPVDGFNLAEQYGRQAFDQKFIFNTFLVYAVPYYKEQTGIIGRLAGGWTFSPVVVAGTGQPLQCTTNNSGQSFGGEDGSNFTNTENCVFNISHNGRTQTHRGVLGSTDINGLAVGTAVHAGGASAAVNVFQNPAAVYDSVRPLILGLDARSGGAGTMSGLGYLNVDMSIKKNLHVYNRFNMEFSGVLYNALNHLDFANPSLSLQSVSSFGVTKTQGNSPRQIQMGVRTSF